MNLIFLGAPGAGKGTQAEVVSEALNIPQISTGNILREAAKNGTEYGLKAKAAMDAGALVSDDIVIGILKERIAEDDCKNGFILDGFPRTAVQAEALKVFLEKNNSMQKRIAIELNISDEEIIKRVVNRVTCSNKSCGAIYNLQTRPPKQEGICDVCGSELVKRADDNEETVTKRLKIYHDNAKELLDFYAKNNALYTVYPKDLDETVEAIKKHLKSI